tara:strand:+ start:2461 stop:3501 length:1041 start_codon:yes stop_codon:yes gene_type:complete
MAEVYTSGGASVHYGLEAANAYGTAVTANKTFGLNSRVTSLSVTTNRIDFNKLGQREPTAYAYGQQVGRLGVGFVMDTRTSHEIFATIYGEDANGSTPFEYPATLGEGQAVVEGRSLTTQVQLQTSQNTLSGSNKKVLITRKLIGGIVNTLGLSTSIGEPLNATVDITFGKEDANTTHATSGTASQTGINTSGRPFTFAHGELSVWNGSALQPIGEIQSVDVNFNQNAELLYKLGSHYATQSFRKVLDITGRFQTTFKDITLLQHLLDQASDSTNLTAKGGIAEDSSSPTVAAKLVFTNPQDSSKILTIELTGLSFDEHSVSGLEPVEVVYQELPFKALAAKVTQI